MTEDKATPAKGSILVVGGGISGLTTTLEAAEVGYEVFLVEKNPYLGGRVAQLNQYFPKLCPPTCGLEINFRRIKDNPKVKVFTLAEIQKVEGTPGNYDVSVKLSPFYSNPLRFLAGLENAGADAFVLFNRLFQPDIDIETETHLFPYNLSHEEDHRLPLRFAGLLFGNTKASVCTNSGIFSGNDVIKMILAGADCVQIVSTLYLNKIDVIKTMIKDIGKWMNSHGYETLESFRGKLSYNNADHKLPYRRAQYMDFMMTTSEILKKYRIIS